MAKIMVVLSFTLWPWYAQAQFFSCKDANGRTITSDRPIPECADRPMRELSRGGQVRREIPAPPTPEEKRLRKIEEEKRAAEALAAEEKMKNDRLILARYSNEKGIEAARQRTLDMVHDQIKREVSSVAEAEAKLKQMQPDLNKYKKNPGSTPPDLLRKAEEAEQAIREGKKIIQEREADTAQINVRFDETLKRYREITEPTASK